MHRIALCLTAPILALCLWTPSAVRAQHARRHAPAGDPAPSAAARAAAREAYGRGQELFQRGDFPAAAAAFQAAYDAVPNPVVLLGLAEAREREGDAAAAVEVLERYLRERADAPDREAVQGRIAALRARPATLAVSSEPSGAAISVDGERQDERTPAEIEVPAGAHVVSVSLAGHEDATQSVEATFGGRQEVTLALEASEPEPEALPVGVGEPEPGPEIATDEEPPGLSAGVWVASAVAGAALVAGTVLGFLALSEQSSFDAAPTLKSADDGERLALFADVGFGLAAAAGITAIVLYLTSGESLDESESAALRLTPTLAPGRVGLHARVAF